VQNTWLRCLTEAQDAFQRTNLQPAEAPKTSTGPCPCCMPISPNEKKTHCDPERCGCCCCRRTRRKSLNQLMPPPPFFQFEPKDTARQSVASVDVSLPEERHEEDQVTFLTMTAVWTDPELNHRFVKSELYYSDTTRLDGLVYDTENYLDRSGLSRCRSVRSKSGDKSRSRCNVIWTFTIR